MINQYIQNSAEKLQVFEKYGVYLPLKKIGKNNPKTNEIQLDNAARTEWNQAVDIALIEGVPKDNVLTVKKEEITDKIRNSFDENGRKPNLFRQIISKAKQRLEEFIHKFKLLLKPKLTVDIAEFQKIESIMIKLKQQVNAIYQVEYRDLPEYRKELGALKGVFKGKECKAIKLIIWDTIEKLFAMKSNLEEVVTGYGHKNVQEFAAIFKKAENQMYKYQNELENWKKEKEAMPPEEQHIRNTVVKLETEMMERDCSSGCYRQQNKGVR